jgi:hypothetical protein
MSAKGNSTPLTVSLSPATVQIRPGLHRWAGTFRLSNSGGTTLTITRASAEVQRTPQHCGIVAHGAAGWMHAAGPAHFTLAPGTSRLIKVTVNAPHSATGSHDIAVLLTASTGSAAQVQVHGTVAGQVLLTLGGHSASHYAPCFAPRHFSAAPPPGHYGQGIPVAAAGGLAGGALLLAVAVLAWRRMRRLSAANRQLRAAQAHTTGD